MNSKLNILSLNVQGLGDSKKCRDVINFLKGKKPNICCIQDTHFTDKCIPYVRSSWGFECYFSNHTTQSRGVAILINNNFDFKFVSVETDDNGNLIRLDFKSCDKTISLFCLYGPNNDSPDFYSSIRDVIINIDNSCILVGDFNLVLDPTKDYHNYVNVNNPRAREKVLEMMSELNLVDCWREDHIEDIKFTWLRKNPIKQARLDFFLISNELYTIINECNIFPGYRSDHSLITLSLDLDKNIKGHSYWKFNNSLLRDNAFMNKIKETIKLTKLEYASVNQDSDLPLEEISNKDIKFNINDSLFYETMLLKIRGECISYASYKKRTQVNRQNVLEKEINEIRNNPVLDINMLEEKEKELQEHRKHVLDGKFIRSKAKWIFEGEKPTNYYCNLENRNYTSKNMSKLISKNGNIITDQDEILSETFEYYKKLYSHKESDDINLNEEILLHDVNKLSEEEKLKLEDPLDYNELLASLKKMSNNSSPGSSGFTVAFYKFFWIDLGYFLLRALNESFENQELSVTFKQGIITCIPKGNKDKMLLKNWRPISLLNVEYKIASASIAARLKVVLGKIISEDQSGFLPGRFIGDNIRLLYDIMYYTEKHNVPGMILLLDFATAFDSLSWKFMFNVLDFFNFGPNIKQWIKTFYTNIVSSVIVNGNLSDWFIVHRGCRQGDPLSPYLFILCAEMLSLLLKQNPNITGIKVNTDEFLVSQYADDTTLLLDGSELSLRTTMSILKFYANISGLAINIDKTRVVWIGAHKYRRDCICQDLKLSWEFDAFTLLGVKFSTNLEEICDLNYLQKSQEIQLLLAQWSKRVLSPIGKNVVLKTLAISKINHLVLSIPNPNLALTNHLQTLFFNYLWSGGPDKVKRNVVTQDYSCGGIRVLEIRKFILSLKLTWLRRFILYNTKYFNLVRCICPFIQYHDQLGSDYIRSKLNDIDNLFWKQVFEGLIQFNDQLLINSWQDFQLLPIWYNPKFKIGGRSCIFRQYYDKHIILVHDLLDENGNFLNYNDFRNIHEINTNFLQYNSIIRSIKQACRNLNITHTQTKLTTPVRPLLVQHICTSKKGCRDFYAILNKSSIIPSSQTKWNLAFGLNHNTNWKFIYDIPFKCTKDPKLHWLQYRINHRILGTKHLLSKMGISPDNLCSFCNQQPETLPHLFWDCEHTQTFIISLVDWFNTEPMNSNITLMKQDFILGSKKFAHSINTIFLIAKLHIYSCKMSNILPTINVFKLKLRSQLQAEKYNARLHGSLNQYDRRWNQFTAILQEGDQVGAN